MKKDFLTPLFIILCFASNAQTTFYEAGGPVPDLTTVQYPIIVSGLPAAINNTYGLENVCLDISHTYDSDLIIKIKSPDGNVFILSNRRGGGGDDFSGTCFRGNGAQGPISAGTAPFSGVYMPDVNLASVNNGQNPNGTWWLIVVDTAGTDTGNVNSMTIRFGNSPTPPNPVSSLPCSVNNALNCWCLDSSDTECDLFPDMTASSMIIDQQHQEYGAPFQHISLANATPNIGRGPMEIHGSGQCFCDTVSVPCTTLLCPDGNYPTEIVNQTIYHRSTASNTLTTWTHTGGTMAYHQAHSHVHVDNWAWYTLRHSAPNPDARTWPIHGTGSKQSFCLVNVGTCTGNYGYCIENGDTLTMADIPNAPFGLVTGCSRDQGIYVGNLDVYTEGHNWPGVILPTTTCNGDYYIVSITDPENYFLESNDDNNWVAVPITLTLQSNNAAWPTPNFSFIQYGLTNDFVNTSLDADSVFWNFGDGNTVMTTADTTTHTYLADGTYIVTLTAFNQCGPRFLQDTIAIYTVGVNHPNTAPFNISAFPNPFDNSTRISYYLAAESEINLEVFNSIGQKVEMLFSGKQLAGKYEFTFGANENTAGNGVYHIRLTSPANVSTLRLVRVH
ncbi:MAG TPA: proprotein convertase P-domain-containing protein [Bacteroidia bacterium]|nr:proprotein convertase P-domain-containing protein [Bacteroidia bacterium]